jgi:hypothetical protein
MEENPYIKIHEQYLILEAKRKAVEAETFHFRDEFMKVFIPDQEQFDGLRLQAKQAITNKKPQAEIDIIYVKMATIYKRWLPCEEQLFQMNPLYRPLFEGLKKLLQDIEKRKSDDGRKIKTTTSEWTEEKESRVSDRQPKRRTKKTQQ